MLFVFFISDKLSIQKPIIFYAFKDFNGKEDILKACLYPMLFVSFIEDFNGKEEILKASHRTQKAYKTKDNNSFSNLRFEEPFFSIQKGPRR